ncbi:cobalt-precorrin 5A hydrolase [Actinopolyspora mzabensis]|uniref:Cobalt-precorrin 5A hydrolase n=1 Tax=Actinopolyspora mzabensis TaxID=995066 RepID=A0A1G8YS02_ACTMZ|nr:cobalamin biosynthesis protein [Actinopolyspora mzabensis]SDK05629.1 cobalt-precorrin 5A hydrolase [Actinopolyspora mzabensis]
MSVTGALAIGIGASSGVTAAAVTEALSALDGCFSGDFPVVRAVATIERAAESEQLRAGLREHSRRWSLAVEGELPMLCYSAEALAETTVPNPSDSVGQRVGTPSVAEAACLRAATELGEGPARMVLHKFVTAGVTLAAANPTGAPLALRPAFPGRVLRRLR